jgi:ATP-dependent helicase/nuclease subunit B
MPVTFVIGRAGSGKTRRCFQSIAAALRDDPLGPPIFWILPRQATFNAERDLACSAELGGFCRARVVSFDQLGREVFDECGGTSIPQLTPLGRQMLIGHLLRKLEPQLQLFGGTARRVGLAAELELVFAELERSGHGADELAAMIRKLESRPASGLDADSLLAKLRDIELVYRAYAQAIGQDRLDQHQRANQVLSLIAECESFRNAQVYVDGFAQFTENQRQLLAGIGKVAAKMEICLLIEPASPTVRDPHHLPGELNLFHHTEQTYRRLYFCLRDAGVEITAPVLLKESPRFAGSPSLGWLERNMFDDQAEPMRGAAGIELIEATDRRAEVDAVAREIKSLCAGGMRLRDIALIARDLKPYHAPLAASFAEHDIPHFVDLRRSAAHHPLLAALRAILEIARFDWPNDGVLRLIKTGLIRGIDDDLADLIENYLLTHFVRDASEWRSSKPWPEDRPLPAEDELPAPAAASVDTARRQLVDALSPVIDKLRGTSELPCRVISTEIFEAFDRLGIQASLEQWISADRRAKRIEQADEHQQVWDELTALFQEMVELLGDELMSLERFGEVLESGFEQFDLALTPPTVDQVLVGQIDRTRSPRLRAVFLLGLCEGEFPAAPADGSILSDRERRELQEQQIDLDPDSRRRLLDERLLGYIAMARTSERLYPCRPTIDAAGRKAAPSVFWQEVRRLFPDAPVKEARPAGRLAPEDIATPRQLVTSLMRWAREPAANEQTNRTWESLYQWLAAHPCNDDAVDVIRYRAWKALSYANTAKLSAPMSQALFAGPLALSTSQLETFASCPFSHFAKFGLRLRPDEREEIGGRDLSQLYRRLLERLISSAIRQGRSWDGPDFPIDDRAIDACIAQIGESLPASFARGGPRDRYLLERARKTLGQFIASQRELLKRSRFRPAFAAVRFGDGESMQSLELTTPAGRRVSLHGQIDRVDVLDGGNDCCVINYRLKASALSMDRVYHGLSLQLLANLLVMRANGRQLSPNGLAAAGAFILQVPREIKDHPHPDEALDPGDPNFHLSIKPRGIFTAGRLTQLDREFAGGQSAVVQAFVKKDGTPGRRSTSDVAEKAEFGALLKHVEQRLGELAGEIASGDISIAPYRLNETSPCAHCDYQGMCRFHAPPDNYRRLDVHGRDGVLTLLTEKSDGR